MHNLETSRLLLEPWHERRVDEFVRLTADDRVMRYIGRGGPWDRTEALERFDRAAQHWREHGFGWRSAVEKATMTWVGIIALNRLGDGVNGIDAGEIEVGWWLRTTAWHRGLGTEGGHAACAEAFERLGAPRVIARCRPANRRSLRVMRRLGMEPWRRATGRYGEELSIHAVHRSAWPPATLGPPAAPVAPAGDGRR